MKLFLVKTKNKIIATILPNQINHIYIFTIREYIYVLNIIINAGLSVSLPLNDNF